MGNRSSRSASDDLLEGKPVFSYDHLEDDTDDDRRRSEAEAQSRFLSGQPETCGEQTDAAFGFDKISAQAVVSSCFVAPSTLLTIRAFLLTYTLTVLVWYWYGLRSPVSMAVSLTSWTQLLTVMYFAFSVFASAKQVAGRFDSGATLSESAALRVTFLLFEAAFTWALVSVLMFWLTEFPISGQKASFTDVLWSVHLHGASLAFCVVDLILARVKFEFVHYVISCALAFTYCALQALVLNPTQSILSTFKWNSFMTVLVLFGVVFGILLSFVVAVVLTTTRDVCHANSDRNQPVIIPGGPDDKRKPGDGEHAFTGLSFAI